MIDRDPTAMPFRMHLVWILVSIVAALPVVGFGSGVAVCSDCGLNPFSYVYVGAVHAVITTLAGGFLYPSQDQAINGWPYIIPLGFVFYGVALLLIARARRRPPTSTPEPTA